ncbi:hypothetical protein GGI07_001829 [Coemansia sp. Benny D115]|nr:hypothetical protein GGI07_001829 [Coemansia sp. Benny D115]
MDRAASNVNTYSGLARAAFGWPLEYLVEFSITLSQLGFACANSVFVATSLRDSFNAVTDCKWSQELPLTAWVAIQALALCPLCLIRHVRGFSRVAIMADVAILLGLVYVLCMGALSLANNGYGENVQLFNKDGYLLFLGTAVYMFEGYALILPVGSALQKPEKLPSILNIVMVLCAAVAIAIGSTSYAAFGEQTQAIVIVNMPSTSVATQIVRVMYALAIIGTTPLMVFPIFQYFERLFYGNASGKQNIRVKVSKSLFRLALLGGVLYFAVVGSERLDRLVAIIGGAACVPLAFVYPPLIHLRLFSLRSSALRWQRLRNCAVAALGIGMCVFVTTSAVRRWGVADAPEELVAEVVAGLNALADHIPFVLSSRCGKTVTTRGKQYTHALVVELESGSQLQSYAVHPAHQEVLAKIKQIISEETIAMDF